MKLTLDVTTDMTDSAILSEVRSARKFEEEKKAHLIPVMINVSVPEGSPEALDAMTPEQKKEYDLKIKDEKKFIAEKAVEDKNVVAQTVANEKKVAAANPEKVTVRPVAEKVKPVVAKAKPVVVEKKKVVEPKPVTKKRNF